MAWPVLSTATQKPVTHDKELTEFGEASIDTGVVQLVPLNTLASPAPFTAAQKLEDAHEM
jgi:hypothetical protein